MKYFDYASTTPLSNDLYPIYEKISKEYFMNTQSNLVTSELKNDSKNKILKLLNFSNKIYELEFTSGGTESNNLAILGLLKLYKKKSMHIICSSFEHPSVLEIFKEIEREGFHEVSYIFPNKKGIIENNTVLNEIKDNTILVALMLVNNELGTIQKVNEIFKNIKDINQNIVTFTDAIQALGKININSSFIDMISFSAHKIYGPQNVGLLIKKKSIKLHSLFYGSKGFLRPGTQSLALEIMFAKAIKTSISDIEKNNNIINLFKKQIISKLPKNKFILNGDLNATTNILNLTFKTTILAESIVEKLSTDNIIISTKSSCASNSKSLSHVLISIDLTKEEIQKTIRISLSHISSQQDVDFLIEKLNNILLNY